MCVIIRHTPNANIPDVNLEACWQKNSDGWGIMWVEEGRVRVLKSLDNQSFLAYYRQLKHLPIGVHFRFKTHGAIDLGNAHPYPILIKERDGRDLYVMHNGTISGREVVKGKSDTWHYVEQVLRPILTDHPDLIHNHVFEQWVLKDIGSSRLLFLSGEGKFTTYNETQGMEAFGCWLSNGHSHHPTYRATQNSTSTSGGAGGNSGGSYYHGHMGGYEGHDEYGDVAGNLAEWQRQQKASVTPAPSPTTSNTPSVCDIGQGGVQSTAGNTFSDTASKSVEQATVTGDTTVPATDTSVRRSVSGGVSVVGGEEKVDATRGLGEPTQIGFRFPNGNSKPEPLAQTTARINGALAEAITIAARKRAEQRLALEEDDQQPDEFVRQQDAGYEPIEPTYLEMILGREVENAELDIDILRRVSSIEIKELCYNDPETATAIILGQLGRSIYA